MGEGWSRMNVAPMALRSLVALAILVSLLAKPIAASASGYAGGTPGWNDMQEIQVVRCEAMNPDYPWYYAVLETNRDGSFNGFMIAAHLPERNGHSAFQGKLILNDPWAHAIDLLRSANFHGRYLFV
jgi:hypothetical protein